ncbi:MAG: hypothetical protein KDD64_12565 [Bdellovibrionales bacterium]|nr:hypothetical protein [Bdellovibrionales bacterium]
MLESGAQNTPEQPRESTSSQLPSDPAKAKRYFEHAESKDAPYAVLLYFSGLAQEPANTEILPALFKRAFEIAQNRKFTVDKSVDNVCDAAAEKTKEYLRALLAFVREPNRPARAVAAFEAAVKFSLAGSADFLGTQLDSILKQTAPKNPKEMKALRSLYSRLMEGFASLEEYEKAANAGDKALKASPEPDGPLQERVKNLSALAYTERDAMRETGIGGFRGNIRDESAQRALEEGDRISNPDAARGRELETARAEYEKRSEDVPTAKRYAKALAQSGDAEAALAIYENLFTSTNQREFLHAASDIRIQLAQRRFGVNDPVDGRLLALKKEEFGRRVSLDPDNEAVRVKFAEVLMQLKEYRAAVEVIQVLTKSKESKPEYLLLLGQAFVALDYVEEAELAFQRILSRDNLPVEQRIAAHYGMAEALLERADKTGELQKAVRAREHIAEVLVLEVGYREIEDLKKRAEEHLSQGRDRRQAS